MVNVLKVGGNQLDDPLFITGMAVAVRNLPTVPVIVHGGGKLISTLQQRLNLQPQMLGGLRVTDAESLAIVKMVLIGAVNPTLVTELNLAGVAAQGLNGADQGLLLAEKMQHPDGDLGFVGRIVNVNAAAIQALLDAHICPVIAPVSVGPDGTFYNVNADQAAGAIAAALDAERVTFLTNVPGVLADGQVVPRLTRADAEQLITLGVATGGMAVKIEAAFAALDAGVRAALITDLQGVVDGRGTLITA
jgi:acetylglutamate kinase